MDVAGLNLAYYHYQSEDNCCSLCKNKSGCRAYAWNDYKNGTCYLKESTEFFSNEGVKSGIIANFSNGGNDETVSMTSNEFTNHKKLL